MRDAVLPRKDGGNDIAFVRGCRGDQEITLPDVGVPHERRTCAVGMDGQDVEFISDGFENGFVLIDQDHVIRFIREQLRDGQPEVAGSDDGNTHGKSFLK